VRREVRRFYADGVVGAINGRAPIYKYLDDVSANGGPLFLKGAGAQVGTTTLVVDYLLEYNAQAECSGLPIIGYVDVPVGCRTIKHLLEAIACDLRVMIPNGDRRSGSARVILNRILGQILVKGIGTLVIDHVRRSEGEAREFVGMIVQELTSEARRAIHASQSGRASRPFGVVLVDRERPESLFVKQATVLPALRGRIVTLDRYREMNDMAQALLAADVGVGRTEVVTPDGLLALSELLEITHGLPPYMSEAFGLVDQLRSRHPDAKLLTLVQTVPKYMQLQVEMRSDVSLDGSPLLTLRARRNTVRSTPEESTVKDTDTSDAKPLASRPRKPTRTEVLSEKRRIKETAESDHRSLLRKQHATLPCSGS